uniref:Uncharacterized protein n=1 Tax=Amphiprion percula TaxID=161767 RepID=A0A3P8T9X5_AMPPE
MTASMRLGCSPPASDIVLGIGRAVCQRFASEGASVVVADISEESANETLGSLSGDLRGQVHMAAVVDVSSKESIKKLVTSIQVSDGCWKCSSLPLWRYSIKNQLFPARTVIYHINNV